LSHILVEQVNSFDQRGILFRAGRICHDRDYIPSPPGYFQKILHGAGSKLYRIHYIDIICYMGYRCPVCCSKIQYSHSGGELNTVSHMIECRHLASVRIPYPGTTQHPLIVDPSLTPG
jgi:hypothetical protein